MARHAHAFAQGGIPQLLGANLVSLTGNHAEGQLRPADIHGMLLDNVTAANDILMRPHVSSTVNIPQHQSIATQPYSVSQPINLIDHAAQQGYVQAITTRSDGKVVKLVLEPVKLPSAGGAMQTGQIFPQQIENASMRPPSHWPSGLPTINSRQLQSHSIQQDNHMLPGQNNLPAFVRMPNGTQLLIDTHRDSTNQYQANVRLLQTSYEAGLSPPRSLPVNLQLDAAIMNGINIVANTPEASRVESFQFAEHTPSAMQSLHQQQAQQRRRQSSESSREPAGKRVKYGDGLPTEPTQLGNLMSKPIPQPLGMQVNNPADHMAPNSVHNLQTNANASHVFPAYGSFNDSSNQQTGANWANAREHTSAPFQTANDNHVPSSSNTVVFKLVAQLVANPSGAMSLIQANGMPLPNLANQIISTPHGPMQLVPSRSVSTPASIRASTLSGQQQHERHHLVSGENNMRVGNQGPVSEVNAGIKAGTASTATGLVPSPYNNPKTLNSLNIADRQGHSNNVAHSDNSKAPVTSPPNPSSMQQHPQTSQPASQTQSRLLVATLSDGRKVLVQPISQDTSTVNNSIAQGGMTKMCTEEGGSPNRKLTTSDLHSRQQNLPTVGLTVPIEETPSGRVLLVNPMPGLADPVSHPQADASPGATCSGVGQQPSMPTPSAAVNMPHSNVVKMHSQSGTAVAAPTIHLVETGPALHHHSKASGRQASHQQQHEPGVHMQSPLLSANGTAGSVYGSQAVLTSPFEVPNQQTNQDRNIQQSTSAHANQGSDGGSSWQGSQQALQHAVQFAAGSHTSHKMLGVLDLTQPRMSDTGSGAHTRPSSMHTVSKTATKESADVSGIDVMSHGPRDKRETSGSEPHTCVTWTAPILWAPEHHADPSKPMFIVTSTIASGLRRQLPETLVVNDFKPAKEINTDSAKETLHMQLQAGSTPAQQASVQQLVQAELCLVCTALPHTKFVVLPKEVGGKYLFDGLLMSDTERRAFNDRPSGHTNSAVAAAPQQPAREPQNVLHGRTSSSITQPHAGGNLHNTNVNGMTAPVLDLSIAAPKSMPGNAMPPLQGRLSGNMANPSVQSSAPS